MIPARGPQTVVGQIYLREFALCYKRHAERVGKSRQVGENRKKTWRATVGKSRQVRSDVAENCRQEQVARAEHLSPTAALRKFSQVSEDCK